MKIQRIGEKVLINNRIVAYTIKNLFIQVEGKYILLKEGTVFLGISKDKARIVYEVMRAGLEMVIVVEK